MLDAILAERDRQEERYPERTCADVRMSNPDRLTVLAEEFGEVAKETCDELRGFNKRAPLREELIQVAAVAVAWIEGLDAEGRG